MGLAGSCVAGGSGAPEYGSRSARAGMACAPSNTAATARKMRMRVELPPATGAGGAILLRRGLTQPASPAADVTRFAHGTTRQSRAADTAATPAPAGRATRFQRELQRFIASKNSPFDLVSFILSSRNSI